MPARTRHPGTAPPTGPAPSPAAAAPGADKPPAPQQRPRAPAPATTAAAPTSTPPSHGRGQGQDRPPHDHEDGAGRNGDDTPDKINPTTNWPSGSRVGTFAAASRHLRCTSPRRRQRAQHATDYRNGR